MTERGDRPWLPGSDPMPEPFYWAGSPLPGAREIPDQEAAQPQLPKGFYTYGLPRNIVNSLYSCLEGENKQNAERLIWFQHNTPMPTPVITVLTPPDAVASGTAPISLAVTGSDFVDVSKVFFNGVAMPTMFYSETKLVAEVQKLAIGYYPVLVKSGDKVSNTLQFRFR
jgi:hypothetical protein